MRFELGRVAAVAATLAVAGCAAAQLYGIDYDTGKVYRVNMSTAAVTLVASTDIPNIASLTVGPDGMVYGYTTGNNATLYKFDPTNGWSDSVVGALGAGFFFQGALTWDFYNDVVYGANYGSAQKDQMFTLNLATGAATLGPQLGNGTGLHDFQGFDILPGGGLIGIDRATSALESINVTTGALAAIGAPLAPKLGQVGGMTTYDVTTYFNTAGPGGVLPGSNELYTINETTGATTLVGSFGATIDGTGISGLVVAAPEPTSLLAMAGLVFGASLRRRGRRGE